jgi:hypothetical protein
MDGICAAATGVEEITGAWACIDDSEQSPE